MALALLGLSLFAPILMGWLLLRAIWPEAPQGLRIGFGASVGMALTGTVYFLALVLFDSSRASFAVSEGMVATSILVLLARRAKWNAGSGEGFPAGLATWGFAVTAILASVAFLLALQAARYGGWDALVMWNLRARLIASSPSSPLSAILDTAFLGLHADYPLLLPSLLSRGFQYAGSAWPLVPMAIAALFTITTMVITIGSLKLVTNNEQAWISGCLLVGTPFLAGVGGSQYADIVICCFMTTTVASWVLFDRASEHAWLPFLGGITAAAAACTKNEGILFLIVVVASRSTVVLLKARGDRWYALMTFGAGASLGLLTVIVFKLVLAPPNETIPGAGIQLLVSRLTEIKLSGQVLEGFRDSLNFGRWYLNPLPLMAIHVALMRRAAFDKAALWFMSFVLAGMFSGYYVVYVLSPYDLESHLKSSFDRLLLQLWPTAVILYSVAVAKRTILELSRAVVVRVGLVVALVAALHYTRTAPAIATEVEQAGTAHIDLSRSEVSPGDTYTIRIQGVRGPQVFISYSLNERPMGQFGAYLGSDGSVDFQVSRGTAKGIYHFLAVRSAESSWIPFETARRLIVK